MMCVFVIGTFPPPGGREMMAAEPAQASPFSFEEVAVYFTEEEWALLSTEQRDLYWDVMQENYENVASLAVPIPKPELISRLERGEGPWIPNPPALEEKKPWIPNPLVSEEKKPWFPNPHTSEEKKIPINICEGSLLPFSHLCSTGIAGNNISLDSSSVPENEIIMREIKEETPEQEILKQAEPQWTLLGSPIRNAGLSPETCETRCGLQRQWEMQPGNAWREPPRHVRAASSKRSMFHVGRKKLMCPECDRWFHCKSEFLLHWRTHTGEKPYECLACGKRFIQSSHLSAHRRIHTGEKPYECPKCGRSFNRRSTLTEHLRIHTGEKPYKCLECGESFRWRPYLTKHQRIHMGNTTYKGLGNGEAMLENTSLADLQGVHTGIAMGSGKVEAGFQHASSGDLQGSIRNPEPSEPKQSLEAQLRERPIKTEAELAPEGNDVTDVSQIRIVQVEKKHVCHECGKAFQYKFELVKHHRTHTGEKPFECPACGKRFFQSTHLNAHLRIHTGEKPYECPKCGRSFNRRSTLTEHLRIHTGEKPYKCLQCGESFRWRPYLTKHQRVHVGDNAYKYFDHGEGLYDSSAFSEPPEGIHPEYLVSMPDVLSHTEPQEEPWLPNGRWSKERQILGSSREAEGLVEPSQGPPEGEPEHSGAPRGLSPARNGIGASDSCDGMVTEHTGEDPQPSSLEELSDALQDRLPVDLSSKPRVVPESGPKTMGPPAKKLKESGQCGMA